MHLISQKALTEFWKVHSAAEAPLRNWSRAIRRGTFTNLIELKASFGPVDYVPIAPRGLHVFNLGGNKYRLITSIRFDKQRIYIRNILTHADYSKGDWKK